MTFKNRLLLQLLIAGTALGSAQLAQAGTATRDVSAQEAAPPAAAPSSENWQRLSTSGRQYQVAGLSPTHLAQARVPTRDPATQPATHPVIVPNTDSWPLTSATGRQYQIFVSWPDTPAPEGGFPVIYTMDGNFMFATMTETVRGLSRRPGDIPQAIVVGIGYPPGVNIAAERRYDDTGSRTSVPPEGFGGAEDMITFIADVLQPAVRERYQVDTSHEAIFGHSFGGYFVLYALVNRPDLFDTYIAASPSIWVQEKFLTLNNVRRRIAAKLELTGVTPRALITVGEYEQAADPDFPPTGDLAYLLSRAQIDNAREYADFLSRQPGLSTTYVLIEGEDHGTVIPAAISRAVRFSLTPAATTAAPAVRREFNIDPSLPPVPSPGDYLAMTPQQRYDLRMLIRGLPAEQRVPWVEALDWMLDSGMTYKQVRTLAEEKDEFDRRHGTAPHPDS